MLECRPADKDSRLNRRQAAIYLGVDTALISYWRKAGLIAPVEVTGRGHTLYRLGDLIEVDNQVRQSPKSSRNWRRGMPAAA